MNIKVSFKLLVLLLATAFVTVGCMTTQVDLGGIELRNVKQPAENLISSGQPSQESLKALKENGLKNVINLRTEGESAGFDEKQVAQELGLNYYSLPISGRSGITFENAKKFSDLISKAEGPTLAHCGSGNRVGALMALNSYLKNGDLEKAIADGKASGLTSLEDTVRRTIESKKTEED
ncbi:fused DSP-PTPase phosphatase/NAD kinase-like protein [Aliikangiella marina]|nr:sulfur transferase domain-containing protein [Aliikangiella marina]